MQLEILQFFKGILINFEQVVEINKGLYFILPLVNKGKML